MQVFVNTLKGQGFNNMSILWVNIAKYGIRSPNQRDTGILIFLKGKDKRKCVNKQT
jgi:hypothetical protein